jgi:hypothetical protein
LRLKCFKVSTIKKAITEFCDVWNVESGDKLFPDLRSQPVAEHDPDFVLTLFRNGGCGQKVSANLADVLSSLKVKKCLDQYEHLHSK